MQQFHILAHGHSFEVDLFLSTSTLIPSLKWNVGQRSHGMHRAITDGFIVYLAEKSPSYQDQQKIALEFICKNQAELQRCRSFPGVDYFLLSLHFVLPLTDATYGFAMNMKMDLLAACVGIGLNPTVFVQLDRKTADPDSLDTHSDSTE